VRNRSRFLLLLLLGVLAFAQNGRTIQVDVTYNGASKVDANHKIYIALWDSEDMNSGPPVATKSIDAKKGSATFTDVPNPAYVSVAFDPTGSWDAQSPPPSGTLLGMYSSNPPKPDAIKAEAGKTAKVNVAFDDSFKVP
jgi:hypothetical protein